MQEQIDRGTCDATSTICLSAGWWIVAVTKGRTDQGALNPLHEQVKRNQDQNQQVLAALQDLAARRERESLQKGKEITGLKEELLSAHARLAEVEQHLACQAVEKEEKAKQLASMQDELDKARAEARCV